MRADDHYEKDRRPKMRRHSLNRVTCDWATERGLQDHPMAVAAAVAATNVQSSKVSPTQRAALLSEWRRCMEALGSELVGELFPDPEPHPTVQAAISHIDHFIIDGMELTEADLRACEMVLAPGSPWRS